MLETSTMSNNENELLLAESNFKSSFPKNYCVRAYYIYLYLIRKIKHFWKSYAKNICACFTTQKVEHVCFFSQINTEFYPNEEPPYDIIYWGRHTDEEVFFSEQEQLIIDYMKLQIKKSN